MTDTQRETLQRLSLRVWQAKATLDVQIEKQESDCASLPLLDLVARELASVSAELEAEANACGRHVTLTLVK
jgi:hypothetical protein